MLHAQRHSWNLTRCSGEEIALGPKSAYALRTPQLPKMSGANGARSQARRPANCKSVQVEIFAVNRCNSTQR
jgi:hypothetical protein